jgi:hypothetical protein
MFHSWIRKKALKRKPRNGKRLVIDGERPNVIALVSVSGLLVAVGIFVLQKSLAAPRVEVSPAASPYASVLPKSSVSPTPSDAPRSSTPGP